MMFFSNRTRRLEFLLAALLVSGVVGLAQAPTQPYAAINRDAVTYAGPGRDAGHDLAGAAIKIGFLAPLQGPRKAEGDALLRAAQLALEDEASNPLPDGRRLALAIRDESGPWGRASSEIARLVFDDQAVALITSADGGAAHLAEQISNKIGVPVLTLSTDKTTTQINLPWIFRLGPSDETQARAFAYNIYRERGLKRVVLVTERDHDGRVGGEEFEKAASEVRNLGASSSPRKPSNVPTPVRVVLDTVLPNLASAVKEMQQAEALVFWTGPETAAKLLAQVRALSPSVPIYLCRKAAQGSVLPTLTPAESAARTFRSAAVDAPPGPKPADSEGQDAATLAQTSRSAEHLSPAGQSPGGIWIVVSGLGDTAARESLARRYQERFACPLTLAAAQAYDAVRIIAAAFRHSGPNRARLRDAFAQLSSFAGVSGIISFDHAGNNPAPVALVQLP